MNDTHEVFRLERTTKSCAVCERYALAQSEKPVAVICCEGACLRGEVARRAADLICRKLSPEVTVRVCLGGAFTKDGGQRNLVRRARYVVAVEGCHLLCASRMMKAAVEGLTLRIAVADKLFEFDRTMFSADALSDEALNAHAQEVAETIAESITQLPGWWHGTGVPEPDALLRSRSRLREP